MEIKIENLGKLKSADIVIDGITVIAGKNNTGKSTISKALYTQFNSFYNYPDKIYNDKKYSIRRLLSILDRQGLSGIGTNDNRVNARKIIDGLSDEILSNSEKYLDEKLLNSLLKKQLEPLNVDKELIPKVSDRIEQILKLTNNALLKQVITNSYNDEFSNQINNVNADNKDEAIVNLIIKNDEFISAIRNNKIKRLTFNHKIVLGTEAVYIDDPTVLNDLNNQWSIFYRHGNSSHQQSLINKLKENRANASNKLIIDKKLSDIFKAISEADEGDMVLDSNGNWIFRRSNNPDLDLNNLSMGLKTFVIIKALLMNESIEENGTLILDEPEIHLHPEWQILLAKIIVLMQKSFGLHILVNTHSPYFMRAIEVYSAKNNIADRCRYYQTENTPDGAIAKDVTMSTDEIYKKLSNPFIELENQEFSD